MQNPTIFQRREAPQIDISGQIGNLNSRIKMLEERYSTLQRKVQLTDQNMLSNNKDVREEIRALSSEISEMKSEMVALSEKADKLVREVQRCTKKEEFDVMKKYLELWEPVHFVTSEQVERIIKEVLESKDGAGKR